MESHKPRGIKMVFANVQAVRLFLQAWAVINFLMQAASTLQITNEEHG